MRSRKSRAWRLLVIVLLAVPAGVLLYTFPTAAASTSVSTVGNTNSGLTPGVCWTGGYYYDLWTDGTNTVYSSSTNGVTWSGKTTIQSASVFTDFPVLYCANNHLSYFYRGSSTQYGFGTASGGVVSWGSTPYSTNVASTIIPKDIVVFPSGATFVAGFAFSTTSELWGCVSSCTTSSSWSEYFSNTNAGQMFVYMSGATYVDQVAVYPGPGTYPSSETINAVSTTNGWGSHTSQTATVGTYYQQTCTPSQPALVNGAATLTCEGTNGDYWFLAYNVAGNSWTETDTHASFGSLSDPALTSVAGNGTSSLAMVYQANVGSGQADIIRSFNYGATWSNIQTFATGETGMTMGVFGDGAQPFVASTMVGGDVVAAVWTSEGLPPGGGVFPTRFGISTQSFATVTLPLDCTLAQWGTNPTLPVWYASPATAACSHGGTTTNLTIFANDTASFFTPTISAGTGYWFSGQANSTTKMACPTGTCSTFALETWQLSTVTAQVTSHARNFLTGLTFGVTCAQAGSSNTCSISSTAAASDSHFFKVDFKSTLAFPSQPTGAASMTRWLGSGTLSFNVTTPAQTDVGNYYSQLENFPKVAAQSASVFTSGLSFVITGTYLGTASTTVATMAPSTNASSTGFIWSDYDTLVSFPSSPTGGPSGGRWQVSGTSSFTPTTAGTTWTVNYYLQWQGTFTINPLPSATNWNAGLSLVVLGFQLGSGSASICTISPTGGVTTSASCSGYTDNNKAATFPADMTGAPAGAQWATSTGSAVNTPTITSSGSHTQAYYKQWSQSVKYSISCQVGATCSNTPTLTYTAGGATQSLGLTLSNQVVFVDTGTTAFVTASVTDSLGASYATTPTSWAAIVAANTITNPNAYAIVIVTQPVTATPTGPIADQTVSAGGCDVSPGTFTGDGTAYDLSATSLCTITVTLPAGYVWSDTHVRTKTFVTCASGTCSGFADSYIAGVAGICVSYQLVGGGAFNPPTLDYLNGSTPGAVLLSKSAQCLAASSGATWTLPQLLGGPGNLALSERATLLNSTTGTFSAGLYTFFYDHQFYVSVSYTLVDSAATNHPTFASVSLLSPVSVTMSKTPASYWLDAGAKWTVTNPFTSTPDLVVWYASPGSGFIASATPLVVVYGAPSACSGPWASQLQAGCFWAGMGPYVSILGLNVFVGLVLVGVDAAIWIQAKNSGIVLTVVCAEAALFSLELPSAFNLVSLLLAGFTVAGVVYRIFWKRDV